MNKINQITQSVVIGLFALIATLTWTSLKSFLFSESSWIWSLFGFLVLAVFLSLSWLLTKSKAILSITLVFTLVSFFLVFGLRIEYLIIALFALLFLMAGSYRAINEKKMRVKLQIHKILQRGLPYSLTAFVLLIVAGYYFSPLSLMGQNELRIPRPLFDAVIEPLIGSYQEDIPTLDLPVELGAVSLNQRVQSEQKQVQDLLYQKINEELNKRGAPYKEYFPLGLSLGLFFALGTLAIPFMWLVILVSWLIFKLLVYFGAVKIQEKAVLQEVIEI